MANVDLEDLVHLEIISIIRGEHLSDLFLFDDPQLVKRTRHKIREINWRRLPRIEQILIIHTQQKVCLLIILHIPLG